MSAWSDWRCGAISESEYRSAMSDEARRDEYADDMDLSDGEDNDDG